MATSRRRSIAVALALFTGAAILTMPALAGPRDKLSRIERRQAAVERRIAAAERDKDRLLGRIQVVDRRRGKVEAQVEVLDGRLAELNAEIDIVQDRLDRTRQELAVLVNELEQLTDRLSDQTEVFTQRAVEAYKAGPTAYIDGLLSSTTFGDLVASYTYYESVLEADGALVEEIDSLRIETDTRRVEVRNKKLDIAADKAALQDDRAEVAAVRADRAQALASLKDVLREKNHLLAGAQNRKRRHLALQDQLDRESDRIEALLAARPSAPAPSGPTAIGARFVWPAPGPLVSGFGYRIHPIWGDRRLHTGIDIGAPYGATVVAGDSGTVVSAGVMSGYGNVILIDHGGGLATMYAHLSAYSVGAGSTVGRGAPIGGVGCTGWCTGAHLHFEVRINGTPVDPMPYLQ